MAQKKKLVRPAALVVAVVGHLLQAAANASNQAPLASGLTPTGEGAAPMALVLCPGQTRVPAGSGHRGGRGDRKFD